MAQVTVVGGGLSGSEAAYQLAERGHDVILHEMRPVRGTPAHHTDRLAEVVCTNSFKSLDPQNAHGLLKTEMRALGSLLLARRVKRAERRASLAIHGAFGIQVLLGIATVMSGVKIELAALHQLVGALLVVATTWGIHVAGRRA